MPSMTPESARAYLAGLALANEFEIEELRKAPVERKLRQLWTLMASARIFEKYAQDEERARSEVRQRWSRLYPKQRG